MNKVLFLCTGNTARSQMAEAFLRKYGGNEFEVYSAGLKPSVINPYTYVVMAEAGLFLEGQRSKGVEEYLGKMLFQYVITVCDDADRNCPVLWMGVSNRLHWSFEDPAKAQGTDEQKLAKFREVRDKIHEQVVKFVETTVHI
jgi:arsenate reductase